jgi:hypothetical protein
VRRRDWDALRDQAVPLTPSDAGLRARELCYLHVEDPELRGPLSFLGPPGGDRPAEVSTGKRAKNPKNADEIQQTQVGKDIRQLIGVARGRPD